MGELIALMSAAFYGMAGITIVKGRADRRGDGGVFLSVLTTAILTGAIWVLRSPAADADHTRSEWLGAIALFAVAGLFASVLGRFALYRATELIGPVGASMLRRLIPLFAIPCGILLISEWPTHVDLIGGGFILAGVLVFSVRAGSLGSLAGTMFGLGSAFGYAISYVLRKSGLETLPDPVLGTCIGALAGVAFYLGWAVVAGKPLAKLHYLLADRSPWFVATALLLSFGQTLQLFALQHSSVAVVSFVGSLDVLFTAVFASLIFYEKHFRNIRFIVAIILVIVGASYLSLM